MVPTRCALLACLLLGCAPVVDEDGDGAGSDIDCDDADAARFPGAPEACDDVDADCDRLADDMDADAPRTPWYADLDGDGFGRAASPREACVAPDAHVANADDCDDAHANAYPGAVEACDGWDGDCDGLQDEDDPDLAQTVWLRDVDADGYGDDADAVSACAAPAGYVAEGADCADDDAAVYPGAEDACGGGDADCDGADDACSRRGDVATADADLVLWGEAAGDNAGAALGLGDVDGDTVADLIVAAPRAEGVAGAAWVARGPLLASGSLADAALRIAGTRDDAPIAGVTLGDLDGDTLAEAIVATPLGAAVWIVDGARTGSVTLDDADGAWTGDTGSLLGAALAAGHDLDGDSVPDLVLGTPGVGGVAIGGGRGGGAVAGAVWLLGPEGGEAGAAVASPGDLDGDGLADLVVGAPGGEDAVDGGAVYVLYGPVATGALDDADARLSGGAAGDHAGAAVAALGDVDGDGLIDLLVGAPGLDPSPELVDAGGAYGGRGPALGDTPLADAHCTLLGDAAGQAAGTTVAALGDLDGAGRGDAALGGSAAADRAWVLLAPFAGTIALTYAEITVVGAALDNTGAGLAGGLDADGDGVPDLLVGSPGADGAGSGAGGVALVRGWAP